MAEKTVMAPEQVKLKEFLRDAVGAIVVLADPVAVVTIVGGAIAYVAGSMPGQQEGEALRMIGAVAILATLIRKTPSNGTTENGVKA